MSLRRRLAALSLVVLLVSCGPPTSPTQAPSEPSTQQMPAEVNPSLPTPALEDNPASPTPPEVKPTIKPGVALASPSPTTGPQLSEAAFHPYELVTALAWSADGELLAAAAGNQIFVLDARSLEQLASLPVGALSPGLVFHPRDRLLAAGSKDGMVRLWDLSTIRESIEPEIILEAHKKGANCVAFSPDGGQLASGGNDAIVRIWDLQTQEPVMEIIGGTYSVPGMVYSPDGGSLGIINGALLRWREPLSGRMLGVYQANSQDPVQYFSASLSRDGQTLALGDHQKQIWVWDLSVGLGDKPDKTPLPDIWEVPSGTGASGGLVWDVEFDPSGRLLASASGDGAVQLWDVEQRKVVNTLTGHHMAVTSLAFSPDGTRLASGSLDGTLRLWQVEAAAP